MINVFVETGAWTAFDVALAAGASALTGSKHAKCLTVWTLLIAAVANAWLFYFLMPSQEGFLFGQGNTLCFNMFVLLAIGICTIIASGDDSVTDGAGLIVAAVAILTLETVGWGGVSAINTWGAGNAVQWSSLAQIETASVEEKLPKTDPTNIVYVTPKIAQRRGQSALGKAGDNLGSVFYLDQSGWTTQSVNKHLYTLNPMEFINPLSSQFGIFSQKFESSPGFYVMDAENPNAQAEFKPFPIRYLRNGVFNRNIKRLVYDAGYTYQDAPTFEVDDSWHPYWTVSALYPKFVTGGPAIKKVLVIDALTGKIDAYEPGETPAWLDRAYSENLALEYAHQWGLWQDASSLNQYPNLFQQYQQEPKFAELLYNDKDTPVYLIPMTSKTGSPSSTGILLLDTQNRKGTFYPGLAGLTVGDDIEAEFAEAPGNQLHYGVAARGLYSISGVPTWVGVYVSNSDSASGQSFAAIGLMNARSNNVANVIMAPNLQTAIPLYISQLISNASSESDIRQFATPLEVEGIVQKITMAVQRGESEFFIYISNDSHAYVAPLAVSRDLPRVDAGDKVRLSVLDTGVQELAVTKLDDLSLPSFIPAMEETAVNAK